MEFGIEKYAMLIMKSLKRQITAGIELPDQENFSKPSSAAGILSKGKIQELSPF